MATRNEKIIVSIIGSIIGGAIAYNKASEKEEISNNEKLFRTIGGALLGGAGGLAIACLLGTTNDTVNYTHYYNGERVYDGITYEHRFDQRMLEHIASGKQFDEVVKSNPKPRVDALRIERKRIKKYRPINNIQHNS